jgi:hypothetical protein
MVKFLHTHLLGGTQQVRDIASVGSEKKEIRRKRKARATIALAFELIDQWMRKFNKRKLYFVVPHLGSLQNNPVERQTIDQALLLKMTEGASDSYATCTDDFCNVLMG